MSDQDTKGIHLMPSEEKHEGLVLRSIDYKDRQKIITLFTPTRGVISLIVKGITRKRAHLLTLTSPFTQAEYLFSVRRTQLYTFRDGTPLNTNHALRGQLIHIEAAGSLAQALLASQLPDKPAPALYQLTLTYLKHLPSFIDPTPLTTSFLLKILKHEGYFSERNSYVHLSPSEWKNLSMLADIRSMPQLKEFSLSEGLHQKAVRLFKELI